MILPGVGIVRVVEEDDHVDLVIGNARVDLLMAALVFRQEQTHGQTRRLRDQTACRRRGGDGMLGEDAFIRGTELNHQLFFLVMRHQGDIHAALLSFASIFYV